LNPSHWDLFLTCAWGRVTLIANSANGKGRCHLTLLIRGGFYTRRISQGICVLQRSCHRVGSVEAEPEHFRPDLRATVGWEFAMVGVVCH
jgi:hypothetical protein